MEYRGYDSAGIAVINGHGIDIKRVMRSKLVLGIADGWLKADGSIIYRAMDIKVGLFRLNEMMQPGKA